MRVLAQRDQKVDATARPQLGMVVFLAIAFLLPWTGWLVERFTIGTEHMFDSFGTYWFTAAPSLAGFVAAGAEDGWRGLQRFTCRVLNLRFPIWLWAVALVAPTVAALMTFVGHPTDLLHGGKPKVAAALATVSLLNFFTGPIAEEFGWRGYLLERFCRRWSPAIAGVIIGPTWVVWHLPLFYDSIFAHAQSATGYIAWVTAWSVILALIVTRAHGSVLPAILCHWALNAQPAIFFALLPALPGEHQPGGLIFSVTSVVVAICFVAGWRKMQWQAVA